MNKKYTVLILCLMILASGFAQREKKTEPTISISTSINYSPNIKTFNFSGEYTVDSSDDLILNFITSDSGTFVIEEGETLTVTRNNTNEFPTQLIGVGASLRIQNSNNVFQEISLTKLGFSKSKHFITYSFRRMDEQIAWQTQGFEQKSGVIGLRYEAGKLFGRNKSKLRFGLTGGLETAYYFYNYKSLEIDHFPIKARVFNLHVSVIPMLTAKLSKKLFLDFKIVSNFLLGENTNIVEEIPFVPGNSQEGTRDYSVLEIDWIFSVQLRYNIKEPKKRRRR